MKSNGFFKTVLLTGLFAGLLDLISAYVTQWALTGKYAAKMLNYIAWRLGLKRLCQVGTACSCLDSSFIFLSPVLSLCSFL